MFALFKIPGVRKRLGVTSNSLKSNEPSPEPLYGVIPLKKLGEISDKFKLKGVEVKDPIPLLEGV